MKLKRFICKSLAAVILSFSLLSLCSCSSGESLQGNLGDITSQPGDIFAIVHVRDYGDITIKLFPDLAPEGVENFVTLAERGYYDGTNIHRIIKDFMFQGGSLNGDGTDGKITSEEYIKDEPSEYACHFYGALCYAQSSPNKNYAQFYVVTNNTPVNIDEIAQQLSDQLDDETIASRLSAERLEHFKSVLKWLQNIQPEIKQKYATVGGEYTLDGEGTVLGQTIEGFDVIDAIAASEVVAGNSIDDADNIDSKPINEVTISSVEIVRIADETETTDK